MGSLSRRLGVGVGCLAVALVGAVQVQVLQAQPPPDYRQALGDLRLARHLLNAPGDWRMVEDQRRAVNRINNAIRDIEQAAIRDHQNPAWREPANVPRIRADRFRQARVAVESAIRNVQQWERNPAASGWQARAMRDLNEAMRSIDIAIADRSYR
jgi:hypothetical protein